MRVRGDAEAMSVAYDGAEMQYAGQGGSIQLCDTLASLYPRAELLLIGLSEPEARIHAVNESASPEELERLAVEAWAPIPREPRPPGTARRPAPEPGGSSRGR